MATRSELSNAAPVTHADVLRALQETQLFFSSPESIPTTIKNAQQTAELIMRNLPDVKLVLADGYPFYICRIDDPTIPVSEIGRFQEEMIPFYEGLVYTQEQYNLNGHPISIHELRERGLFSAGEEDPYGREKAGTELAQATEVEQTVAEWIQSGAIADGSQIWPCPSHIVQANLPNLRDACRPCTQTSMKPRNVLRVMHDADLQMIVSGDPLTQGKLIREVLHDHGIACNDESLNYVMRNAGKTFPVDVAVIEEEAFSTALEQTMEADWIQTKVPAVKLWLRDEQYNWPLGINLGLSMELVGAQNSTLQQRYAEQFRRFCQTHDPEDVIAQLSQLPRVYHRMLQSTDVQRNIHTRHRKAGTPFCHIQSE